MRSGAPGAVGPRLPDARPYLVPRAGRALELLDGATMLVVRIDGTQGKREAVVVERPERVAAVERRVEHADHDRERFSRRSRAACSSPRGRSSRPSDAIQTVTARGTDGPRPPRPRASTDRRGEPVELPSGRTSARRRSSRPDWSRLRAWFVRRLPGPSGFVHDCISYPPASSFSSLPSPASSVTAAVMPSQGTSRSNRPLDAFLDDETPSRRDAAVAAGRGRDRRRLPDGGHLGARRLPERAGQPRRRPTPHCSSPRRAATGTVPLEGRHRTRRTELRPASAGWCRSMECRAGGEVLRVGDAARPRNRLECHGRVASSVAAPGRPNHNSYGHETRDQ